MIVRDAGANWQVVLQTDHADLSSDIARHWTTLDKAKESVVLATERHDDGWAVWEQSPAFEPGTGRPVNFLDVHISSHLAFYRAGIAAVSEQDPYAGLLISMHGAGIYRQRYGSDPNLKLTREPEAQEAVDAFVAEQEEGYPGRIEALGLDEDERWESYNHLQMFDRLSLYFCVGDVEGGEAATIGDYQIEPVSPWQVTIEPFPFDTDPAQFKLVRRLVPKASGNGDGAARAFYAIEPETVDIVMRSR
jgi:hypothetical protein